MSINNLYANIKLQEGKFIRQLKKYLNELVSPSPNLPDDDIFDDKTEKSISLLSLLSSFAMLELFLVKKISA